MLSKPGPLGADERELIGRKVLHKEVDFHIIKLVRLVE